MKVAAVQIGIYPNDPDRGADEAEALIRVAVRNRAKLVCLPEHWLASRVITSRDSILKRFAELAEELGAYLNLGANYESRGDNVRLTSHTISQSGKVISRQDKMHLYRRETKEAVPGSGFGLANVGGVKVGVLICHDAVFPETARILTLMGAELLVVPALISATGSQPWLAYLRARSLENRVPIVSPNVFHPPQFTGQSRILDLQYDKKEHVMHLVERRARPQKAVLVAELDLKAIRALREERLNELRGSGALASLQSVLRVAPCR